MVSDGGTLNEHGFRRARVCLYYASPHFQPGKDQAVTLTFVPDDVTQRVVQGSACIKFLEELGSVDFVLCYLESKGL